MILKKAHLFLYNISNSNKYRGQHKEKVKELKLDSKGIAYYNNKVKKLSEVCLTQKKCQKTLAQNESQHKLID